MISVMSVCLFMVGGAGDPHVTATHDVSPQDLFKRVHLGPPPTSIGKRAVGLRLKDPLVPLTYSVHVDLFIVNVLLVQK